jgi:SAM-dependent methyltransferase
MAYSEDTSLPWPEILEGSLTCKSCGQEYPIRKGVPRMTTGPLPEEVQQTVDGFGWEWNMFNEQIQDTYMTDKAHFLDFIYPTTDDFFEGKLVLDAGCGMGRFLKLGAGFGSSEIIGVDLSHSVEAAYRNTRALPNAHVVKADISNLPFVEKFDYIFSVGVLHHMQSPQEGFSQLARLLREKGTISVWVYSKENNGWVIHFLTPLRKHITSHLPKPVLFLLSHFLGLMLYICVKLIYKPANENRLGLKLGRLLPYNDYLYYISRLNYASLVSVIFDHLVPQLASYVSKEELKSWFCEANLSDVMITSRNNMSWRGHGMRDGSLELE